MDTEAQEPDEAAPLATVIGKNARRLRRDAGLKLDQVSIAARMRGLNWSESRVADFESGRVAPNLATLIAVRLALADAGRVNATFQELLRSESPIQLNDSLLLGEKQLVAILTGKTVRTPRSLGDKRKRDPSSHTESDARGSVIAERSAERRAELLPPPDSQAILTAVINTSGATEERARKALGISLMFLAELSAALWKRTFSQERDRRAGKGANAQKRGQVSRQMRKELQAAIGAATSGDDK